MPRTFFKDLFVDLVRILKARLDNSELGELGQLNEFLDSRAAYVAQTSLYGYLKTRMGRQYVEIFQDERFASSLNRAKWQLYFACLSDLTVYAVAKIVVSRNLGVLNPADLANACFAQCVRMSDDIKCPAIVRVEALNEFKKRADATLWANASVGASAFTLSPETLASSSPVTEEFQELDREIVLNSVRFRWNNIRDEFTQRFNGDRLFAAWQQGQGFESAVNQDTDRTD